MKRTTPAYWPALALSWLFLIGPVVLFAQTDKPALALPGDTSPEDTVLIPPLRIAPLDTLIARALAYSPMLDAQDQVIESNQLTLKQERWNWLKMARAFSGVSYGNGQILSQFTDGGSTVNSLSLRQDLIYNVGVNLTLSPYELVTRKKNMQAMEADIYRSRFDRMVLEDRIAETVINRYQDLMVAVEVQRIHAINLQTHKINAELAVKFFQTGDLSFAEYSRALESRMKSEIDFQTATNAVERAYLLLESVVGDDLH